MSNVSPKAKVISRLGNTLVSPYRLEEPGIELGIPGYKASGLSATPQRLVCIWFYYFSLL